MSRKRKTPTNTRFGIGEWYGRLFFPLPIEERQELAARALGRGAKPPCPFKPTVAGEFQPCTKKGGVCSLRLYEKTAGGGAIPIEGKGSSLRAVCPNRFREKDTVATWVGEMLIGTDEPLAVGEVGFLTSERLSDLSTVDEPCEEDGDDVGRIDSVLMHPNLDNFAWCAVELQAVYFSCSGMTSEFKKAETFEGKGAPFPTSIGRLDYPNLWPKDRSRMRFPCAPHLAATR